MSGWITPSVPSSNPPKLEKSVTARCSFPTSRKPSGFEPKRKENKLFNAVTQPLTNTNMKKLILSLLLIATFISLAPFARAAEAAATNVPVPTLEQRGAGLEAYLGNGDPTAPLKDQDGKIPTGLTTPSVRV